MAHEATLIFETSPPIPFTVANATGIEKGAVLKGDDPMTAIASSAADDECGGLAASEKIASDGKVKLGVYRGGIFKVYVSGSCSYGDVATTSATNNYFKAGVTANVSGSVVFGTFLEDATTGQTALMELRPQAVSEGVI